MNYKNKKDPKNWTEEETARVVSVFEWLLKEDRKQNPKLYKNQVVKNNFGEDITL